MRLTLKFTLAFLFVSLVAIGLAAIFIWGTTSFEFNRYLVDQRLQSFADASKSFYEQNSDWAGIERFLQQRGLLPPPTQAGVQQPLPPPFALLDQNRVVIIPSGPYLRNLKVPKDTLEQEIKIQINGNTVGVVVNTGQPLIKNSVEQQYSTHINQALLIAALGGTLIAMLLGFVLARSLSRPVNELTSATRAMALGNLEQQVTIHSHDELGELAASFNQMSADLTRANQARRQMTADIAHDLRNPLTVIGGYLESLQDGVLKATPERFETMLSEVRHLDRLVEDLRTLSLADSGELIIHRQPVAPNELLDRLSIAYQHQAKLQNINLRVALEAALPEICVDSERIEQVLGNLVSNALRYTPPGGEILLSTSKATDGVLLSVTDNGSGIAPEILPHIFERSYQGDPSRQGNESGLGLSIARSIIELHDGRISADSAGIGKGVRFSIFFPT
ncbi:MAG: ATP-binding protein [Chloroflexi bacterium]|nr:ATP-binding protein [Chloroflexota bacterium]